MEAKRISFDNSGIVDAAGIVRGGGLVVYPTDTVYGLGVDPRNARAVDRLFSAKRREAKPIPILCDSLSSARELVYLNQPALRLAAEHWPGALTIVAPMRASLPYAIHQGTGTLGVRVPDLPLCSRFIALCGGWLTGTSANVSGEPACTSAEEARRALGPSVDAILDGGIRGGTASTVVRVTNDGIEVLREGPVRVDEKETAG